MIPIICSWCICTVLNTSILECSKCETGDKQRLLVVTSQLEFNGQLLNAECYPKGTKPEVNWTEKRVGKK